MAPQVPSRAPGRCVSAEVLMSSDTPDEFHAASRERRFLLVLAALHADAVLATRSYRLREIHRGRGLCGATLCDECEQDVQVTVFELFDRYERAHAAGQIGRAHV